MRLREGSWKLRKLKKAIKKAAKNTPPEPEDPGEVSPEESPSNESGKGY